MRYIDKIYGDIDFPDFIEELIQTPQLQRLHNISQDVLPQHCVPWKVPSRFQHSLGVCALSLVVTRQNPTLNPYSVILPVAALLHDTGNPALSHLSEPFLKQVTGKDGESFLEEMLDNSEAGRLIDKLGLSTIDVVNFVTGHSKPISTVLNGSMDIDNLDNVNRYWFEAKSGEVLFNAPRIASSYRFLTDTWELHRDCFEEAQRWQAARKSVYQIIYGNPHLNAAMMVYRAVDIAFSYGEISESFFNLDDTSALEFLGECNQDSAILVKQALAHEWYPEIISIETTEPNQQFKNLAKKHWNARNMMAEYIREQMKIPRWAICVYLGKGRDNRKIELPFVDDSGLRIFDTDEHKALYRIKIYVHPDYQKNKKSIEYWVKYMTS